MNVFDLFAVLTLNSSDYDKGLDEAAGKADSFGNKIKTGLGNAAKVLGGGIIAGGTAAIALTRQATAAYSNYEQLVGGVETLFGTGGKSLEEYAASVGQTVEQAADKYGELEYAQQLLLLQAKAAFKDSGLSMNEYMQQATSFAAALVNSLEGNTLDAVEIADVAIGDMSDNANKMGTSMEAIQNAYNGFAKGNFTMLDNLKLGYGGTKGEMERLLKKAEEITKAQGFARDFSIDSFSDIVMAIHLVQNEMGIYGTTAKEAEGTISGSMATTKAAWQNLVLSFSMGTDDIADYLAAFIQSAQGTFTNMLPIVEKALIGIGSFVEQVIPVIIEKVPPLITELLPSFVSAVSSLIVGVAQALPQLIQPAFDALIQIVLVLAQAIIDNAPAILTSIGEVIANIWTYIQEQFPVAIQNGIDFLTNFSQGFTDALPTLTENLVGIIGTVINMLLDSLPQLLLAGYEMITNLAQGVASNLPTIITSIGELLNQVLARVMQELPTFWQKGWDIVSNMLQGILNNLPAILSAIATVLSNLLSTIVANLPQMLSKGMEIVKSIADGILKNLPTIVESIVKLIAKLLATIVSKLPEILAMGVKLVGEIATGLIQGIPKLLGAVPKLVKSIWDGFTNVNWLSVGGGIINGIANGVTSMASSLWNTVQNVAGGILGSIKSFFGIHSPSTVFRDQVGKMLAIGLGEGFEDYLPIDGMVDALTGAMDDMASVDAPVLNYNGAQAGDGSSSMQQGSGIIINIYGSEYQDEDEIARAVERKLTMWNNQQRMALA